MIKVSKTGENELLIYKSDGKGGHINVLIDMDGYIELCHIKKARSKSYNKYGVTIDEAIEFINQ